MTKRDIRVRRVGQRVTAYLAYICLVLMAGTAFAADEPGCFDCHDDPGSTAHRVLQTAHGSLQGGGANACTTCHGASEEHDRRGKRAPPEVSFGPRWPSAVEARNAACLNCHESGEQLLWAGSAHQQENMACDTCHDAHRLADLALDHVAAEDKCLDCHTDVRAQLHLPSRHPIAEGKTACRDCHNPHGGLGDSALRQVTLNDNCFSCHQEMRGPFLWEHPPAAEDCSECHRPHGSVHPRLLNARGPALCQQCHAAAFHPSVPYDAAGLPGAGADVNLLGKNCLNCHGRIHGSNHPSGARLTR